MADLGYGEPKPFIRQMDRLIQSIKRCAFGEEIIITGDLNLHLNKPTLDRCIQFRTLLDTHSLKQLVIGATHNKGNTLDVFCASEHIHTDISVHQLMQLEDQTQPLSDLFMLVCMTTFLDELNGETAPTPKRRKTDEGEGDNGERTKGNIWFG